MTKKDKILDSEILQDVAVEPPPSELGRFHRFTSFDRLTNNFVNFRPLGAPDVPHREWRGGERWLQSSRATPNYCKEQLSEVHCQEDRCERFLLFYWAECSSE